MYHHRNVVGWVCWQIQPIAQTDGERAGVLHPLVAMVKGSGEVSGETAIVSKVKGD